jgi:hypothetical protein
MPAVLIAILLLRREWPVLRRFAAAAALLLPTLAVILPWQIHTYHRLGRFQLLSTGGLPSIIDGLTYARPAEDRAALKVAPDVANLMSDLQSEYASGRISTTSQLAGWMFRQLAERPGAVLKLAAAKVVRCWYATDSHRHERALMLLQIPYGLALLGAFIAARRRGPDARKFATLVLALACYYWLMSAMVLSIVRYMVPVVALLMAMTPALLRASPPEGTTTAPDAPPSR